MDRINAKAVSENVIGQLNISNRVHSSFDKGINIEGKDSLVFIGGERMKVPLGIHLSLEDLGKLGDLRPGDKYRFNRGRKELLLKGQIIDLSDAEVYSSYVPENLRKLDRDFLQDSLNKIVELDFQTGFDLSLKEVLFDTSSPAFELRENFHSKDGEKLEEVLRKLIGRGKGLTPSGDDLILGLLLVNRLYKLLSPLFLHIFKELIMGEILTTRVSMNYYEAGLKGEFSSPMIDFYWGIIKKENKNMAKYIKNIINYGHTSGRDTLTGIAIGIDLLINI